MYQTTYFTHGNFAATSARIERTVYYRGRYWTSYVLLTIYTPDDSEQWHTLARSVYVAGSRRSVTDDYRHYYRSRKIVTDCNAVVPEASIIYHRDKHYFLPAV